MFREALPFPLNKLSEIPQRPQDFRLIERIPLTLTDACKTLPLVLAEPVGDEKVMAILDFETTGLEWASCDIIELGLVKVSYSPSAKRLTALLGMVSMYEEPTKPIPELITSLTGISDDMVAGKRIDDDTVISLLADVDLICAHNAGFDRPFFDKRFPSLAHHAWACSASGIDWQSLGFESKKLEYLLMRLGYFYEGHRAVTDCLAVIWLLHCVPESCAALLEGAAARTAKIAAFGAPFDVKDELKGRGYRWHDGTVGANKHWGVEIDERDLAAESAFLEGLYRNAMTLANVQILDAHSRFKGI